MSLSMPFRVVQIAPKSKKDVLRDPFSKRAFSASETSGAALRPAISCIPTKRVSPFTPKRTGAGKRLGSTCRTFSQSFTSTGAVGSVDANSAFSVTFLKIEEAAPSLPVRAR